jgi:hypothetical protein
VAQGTNAEPEQISDGAYALEGLIKHIQATTEMRWNIVERTQAVTANATSVTLSSSTDVIDIYNCFLRDGDSLDTQLRLVDSNFFDTQYRNHTTEVMTPTIAVAQFDRNSTTNVASVTLTIYPAAPVAYTLHYRALVKQTNMGAGTDNLIFDEMWRDVLVYGLASRLADEYVLGVDRCQYLEGKFQRLLEDVQRKSRSTRDTLFLYPV